LANKSRKVPWTYRIRGLYVLLALSLLVNAITLSFIGYVWHAL